MTLRRLDRAGLRSLEQAVRGGEPVRLGAGARPRPPVALDEIVPLCHGVEEPSLEGLLPPAARRTPTGVGVSVVIPTSRAVPIGLDALRRQSLPVEVIVLTNGPNGPAIARELAGRPGVRVEPGPWSGHGATRDRGVALARHPYVFCTVDDAVPLGAGFLARLVEVLEAGGFDAVVARQIPWPTSDPVTRARLRRWTPPTSAGLEPHLDNVAALYRRDVLLGDPFGPVPIAEDEAWGRRHRVGYAPDATVVHAHERRFWSLYTRTRDIHRELGRRAQPAAVPDLRHLLRALPGTVGRDFPGALGELLGQWAGARAARSGGDAAVPGPTLRAWLVRRKPRAQAN